MCRYINFLAFVYERKKFSVSFIVFTITLFSINIKIIFLTLFIFFSFTFLLIQAIKRNCFTIFS